MQRGPPVRPTDTDAANAGPQSRSAKNARGGRACSSGSSLVVEACVGTQRRLSTPAIGVLTEIDVRQTMKAKLDVVFRPYIILGACNPPLAHRALSADLGIGLLLPCNVVVYDNGDGTSTIEAMDPEAALGLVGDSPAIAAVAREAAAGLRQALDALTTS